MIIKYSFSATGRRVAKIMNRVDKDYTKVFRSEFQRMKTKDLSQKYIDMTDQDQKLTHFTKPYNLNKYIKQEFNKKVNKSITKEIDRIRLMEVDDKTLKWQENNIMAEEVKKFEKLLFQKKERLRLIKSEDNRVENYLPQEYLQKKGEIYYQELKNQHEEYQNILYNLHNQRIQGMQKQINNPYEYLVKSQLLIQYPNLKLMIENHMQQIGNSNLDTQIDELKQQINNETSIIDWDSVKQFYIGMYQNKENSLVQYSQHSQSVTKIKDYQDYLFDKFYNNSLQMRTHGQIQFNDLTEEECTRYVKYDIQSSEILMKLITTMDKLPSKFTPKVVSSCLQKLVILPKDYIALLKDERFRILLNHLARAEFDDQSLAQTILALSLLQPKQISYIYDKLSYHIYDNLTNQLLPRLNHLKTPQLAMICRNFHNLPISKNLELQHQLVNQIISTHMNEANSVYEIESFINFMSKPLINYPSLKTQVYQLLEKMLTLPQAKLDIDSETLSLISLTILKIQDIKPISSLFKKHSQLLQPAIEVSECQQLSLFTLMLSHLDLNKNSIIVKNVKKRFIDIVTQQKKAQDEQDIATIISSLTQIDIKMMYPIKQVNEIILLQSFYQRSPYGYKSAYHTPYKKFLSLLQNYGKMFQDKSLIIILHSLLTINHINQDVITNVINQIDDVQYLFPLYVALNKIDSTLDILIDKFNKQNNITIQGVIFYLQAMLHFNKLQMSDLDKIDLEQIDKLDETSKCFLMLLITAVSKCQQGQNIYNKLKNNINEKFIEQKYLLLLSKIPCQYEQGELSLLLNQMRQNALQKNKEIGIEKYLPEQIIDQAVDLLQKQNRKPQKNVLFPLYQADICVDNDIGIQFISVNEMIQIGDKFDFNGIQRLIQKRTKVKYIIYEEYVRSSNPEELIKF